MKKLGADGVFLVHNHPSGNSIPSNEDKIACKHFCLNVPGFISGIVIGKDNFSIITVDKDSL